jgi:hypothetical protein|tara:strand:+ start:716 stop:955 length:240 start_codon:yes stop_codon:yes gene_type:complete
MERNSTLQYKDNYERRIKLYESRESQPVEREKGLGNRLNEKKPEKKVSLDEMLQDVFNMIRDNNKMLLESANVEEDVNV